MLSDNVKAYAKEYVGGPVERVGTWKGYIVYIPFKEPIDGMVPPTGLPSCILEKNGTLKFVIGKEAFTIMDEYKEDADY